MRSGAFFSSTLPFLGFLQQIAGKKLEKAPVKPAVRYRSHVASHGRGVFVYEFDRASLISQKVQYHEHIAFFTASILSDFVSISPRIWPLA